MSTTPRRLSLPGLQIECDVLGEPNGLPLVLLHGFTGHRDDFEGVRDRLATWTQVIVPDLRGHGGATHDGGPELHTFEALVGDVGRVLDALDVQRCHLLGHSMGGMVALRFTLAHAERVASLILMSTSPEVPTGMQAEGLRKAGEIAIAKGMNRLQELVERRQRAGNAADPGERHIERWADVYWPHMKKRYAAMDPNAYMGFGQAMATQSSLEGRLREIDCPTTIVIGEDDAPFLAAADVFEKGIAGAERRTIPEAGHHPHQENPDGWWAAMESHWARVRDLA